MTNQISVVTLGVSNINKSRKFYENGLGWKPINAKENILVYYRHGSIHLALYSSSSLAEITSITNDSGKPQGILLSINLDSQKEVNALLNKAKAGGGTILKPACKNTWGGYSGFFSDPDGHSFEVVWNPKWL